MLSKHSHTYQLKMIQQIENQHDCLYFCRYNNLNQFEMIQLKKQIKDLNGSILIFKQKLLTHSFIPFQSQGCLMLIYSPKLLDFQILSKIQSIQCLFLIYKKIFFSKIKIQYIQQQKPLFLNYQIKQPLFYLFHILRQIK